MSPSINQRALRLRKKLATLSVARNGGEVAAQASGHAKSRRKGRGRRKHHSGFAGWSSVKKLKQNPGPWSAPWAYSSCCQPKVTRRRIASTPRQSNQAFGPLGGRQEDRPQP